MFTSYGLKAVPIFFTICYNEYTSNMKERLNSNGQYGQKEILGYSMFFRWN